MTLKSSLTLKEKTEFLRKFGAHEQVRIFCDSE